MSKGNYKQGIYKYLQKSHKYIWHFVPILPIWDRGTGLVSQSKKDFLKDVDRFSFELDKKQQNFLGVYAIFKKTFRKGFGRGGFRIHTRCSIWSPRSFS